MGKLWEEVDHSGDGEHLIVPPFSLPPWPLS